MTTIERPARADSKSRDIPQPDKSPVTDLVADFADIRRGDVARYGGKNASLGEMVGALEDRAVVVPPGFATSADLYREFVDANQLGGVIDDALSNLSDGSATLQRTGERIRAAFLGASWPLPLSEAIVAQYHVLCSTTGRSDVDVAVRSSATAEDLPDASFAGQQETYLNVRGEHDLLDACRRCFASLYTNRAISYREAKGFDHRVVALSVGVQLMVRSDLGGSGVMFTIDTETGFEGEVVINGAWGLGESVVQGTVDPDEYRVFKPLLVNPTLVPVTERRLGAKAIKMIYAKDPKGERIRTVDCTHRERAAWVLDDEAALALARAAVAIELHYGCPMDIEWARDGVGGKLYIVQARPETVQSNRDMGVLRNYSVSGAGETLTKGIAIGAAAISGEICLIDDPSHIDRFVDGSILVTANTDPDWVPIMRRAAAIVTDHGGRTSHAAIVSRELGLPAIVGVGDATRCLAEAGRVTVSCAEGEEGVVYAGEAVIHIDEVSLSDIPQTRTKVMLNLANPRAATRWWSLPSDGVGLARMEFVVAEHVKVHPMALVHPERIEDEGTRLQIAELTEGYADPRDYFVETLARGLARIAATAYPNPVIVRLSDFKTNEYANLLGGTAFEPKEENPMIGFRGASRYSSQLYREGFALECRAIRRLRGTLGFNNVVIMVPFCRTPGEADAVLTELAVNDLIRGEDGLEIYVMAEVPSNIVLAEKFAERFDGFSIGSNDLTQLTLGVDRDSELLASLFDERDEAVEWMIAHLIESAKKSGTKTGICGQGPSDHPEFARFLVARGIDSISVTPDSFLAVKRYVAMAEREAGTG